MKVGKILFPGAGPVVKEVRVFGSGVRNGAARERCYADGAELFAV
jgi:hypothetical protein